MSLDKIYQWLDDQVSRDLISVAAEMREKFNLTRFEVSQIISKWVLM